MSKYTLLKLINWRIREIIYLVKTGKIKMAYTYIWVTLFTRGSGANLLDPVFKFNPSLAPYPKTIEIEITTMCHLKCKICENTYWNEPKRNMSFEDFKKIIDQFPDLKWINVTGIGSSFLNKDFMKMLRYLKSKSVYVELFDTFTLIDENIANELVEIGIDKIYLSIDGATKETYENIRVGADFDKVLTNVKALLNAKKELNSPIPEVWFHYIINKLNVHEMPQFIDFVSSLKANEYGGSLVYWSDLLYFKDVEHLITKIPDEIKQNVLKKGKELGIEMWWNPNVDPCEPIQKCVGWTEPFILSSGHVQPCCAINEANQREFQKKYAAGNLLGKDFHDIWDNEFKQIREMIHNGEVPKICRNCRIFVLPKNNKIF